MVSYLMDGERDGALDTLAADRQRWVDFVSSKVPVSKGPTSPIASRQLREKLAQRAMLLATLQSHRPRRASPAAASSLQLLGDGIRRSAL